MRSDLHVADQVVHARLEPQLVVELVSSATVIPSVGGDGPALAADRARRAPRRARARGRRRWKRPPSSSLEPPLGERGADLAQRLAELRPEHAAGSASRAARTPRPRRTRPPSRAARRRSPRACALGDAARPRRPAAAAAAGSFSPDVERACRPSSTTARTSRDLGRAAPSSGCAHRGPAGEVAPTALAARARDSARGARRGTASPARSRAATGRARTRASGTPPRPRSRSAAASGGCTSSRGRRRTPRTPGSRRPRASPRRPPRLADELVRPRHHPAVERPLHRRPVLEVSRVPARTRDVARTATRNATEFQKRQQLPLDLVRRARSRRAGSGSGGCAQYCQRITSAPMRANASSASIMFPHEPCISRPCSSSIFS